jgi:MoxR-like ATPase
MPKISDFSVQPLIELAHLSAARAYIARITLTEPLIDYIVDIIRATRQYQTIETGASPRAANMMAAASRAYAALNGREFVIPDDVKRLALPLLRHRIVMTAEADIEGVTGDQALRAILDQTQAPR